MVGNNFSLFVGGGPILFDCCVTIPAELSCGNLSFALERNKASFLSNSQQALSRPIQKEDGGQPACALFVPKEDNSHVKIIKGIFYSFLQIYIDIYYKMMYYNNIKKKN